MNNKKYWTEWPTAVS